jgi:antirestriction protein ArdC
VEELVAEMSAALMCAHAGIDNTLENSASYIAGWVKRLQDEPKMLMTAAARAQKAFAHVCPDAVKDVEIEE